MALSTPCSSLRATVGIMVITDDLLPISGPPGWRIFRASGASWLFGLLAFHERFRDFVADRAVWSYLVIVSAPSFQFLAGVFEAHEPVRVQTLRSELAIE